MREYAMNITISDQDILRLKVVIMDKDKEDAFLFIKDCIIPEIQKQESKTMINHLDGGKGSMF
jgi:hypothetical protein